MRDIPFKISEIAPPNRYFYQKKTTMKPVQIFFFLLVASTLPAQNYHPFIQYGVYRDEFSAPELAICYYTYGTRYWFSGDTAVNGQTYFKLWASPIHSDPSAPSFCPPYTVDTMDRILYGLMREDLPSRRVYRYYPEAGAEYLLYDFDALPGDSLEVGYPQTWLYVGQSFTEIWNDGSERNVWNIESTTAGATLWVESLGNKNGIWEPAGGICLCPYAVCYQQDGNNLYGSTCATAVAAGEPARILPTLLITPNPASAEVRVTGADFDGLMLRDFSGKTVLTKNWSTAVSSTDLDAGSLPRGLYQIILWRQGQAVGAGRLCKM